MSYDDYVGMMKKRKRKMDCTKLKLCLTNVGPLVALVMIAVAHSSVICVNLIVPTSGSSSGSSNSSNHNQSTKYLLTQSKFWVTNASMQSDQLEPKRGFAVENSTATTTTTKISGDEDAVEAANEARAIPENLVDDLLAVESHSRLSLMDKHPTSQYAPYASNLTQASSNQANHLFSQNHPALKTPNNTTADEQRQQQQQKLHTTQPYRPPPPVFVRHPPSRQELRLLYPGQESLKLSAIGNQSQWPWGFGHSSIPLGWPPAHQQPLFFLPARSAGRPVVASTAAPPSSWPSWYLVGSRQNKSSSAAGANNNKAPAIQQDGILPQQAGGGSSNSSSSVVELELELELPKVNQLNKTINVDANHHNNNWSSTTESSSRNQASGHDHKSNIQHPLSSPKTTASPNYSNRNIQFPSVLSSISPNAEDELEHSLTSGHYQRTNYAANMSWAQLLRQATEGNVMESLMVTNRTMISLVCDTNDMLIKLKFKQPFRGLVATNLDRRNTCRLEGTGVHYYEMRISLQDCGTRQESPRLFINNIQIQFHQSPSSSSLDLASDELKTVICSYPIRPVAPPPPPPPPPPERPSGLPERIIEASGAEEPARLVYYEPLVLVSGLILLALTLLGLTASAYMLSRRRNKGSRPLNASGRSSVVSSRLYRNPPAQLANLLISPPLIGVTKPKSSTIGLYMPSMSPNLSVNMNPGERRRQNNRATAAAQGRGSPGPIAGTFGRHSRLISTVSVNPAGDSGGSGDSLADNKNDRLSVTTIEIPYAGEAIRRDEETPIERTRSKASHPPSPSQISVNIQDANKNNELGLASPSAKQIFELKEDELRDSKVANTTTTTIHDNNDGSSAAIDQIRRKSKSKPERRSKLDAKEPKEKIQVRQMSQPFESLRPTLTSPREFKRLQEIAGLFDEISIENHVDRDDESSIVYNTTRLSPSKYKTKILDSMKEDERRKMGHLLENDEIFRSLVVESTNREMFHRKLRENPTYSNQFKPEAWQLLEEILLDPDISSDIANEASLTPPGTLTNKVHSNTEMDKEPKGRKTKSPVTEKKPHRRKSKMRRKQELDYDESVLADREAGPADRSQNSGPRLQSESEIKWLATPGSGDSLESTESRVCFVMYERHLFVT